MRTTPPAVTPPAAGRRPALAARLRRRGVLIAAGTAVVLAVGGGATAAYAAGTATTAPSASASADCTPHLGAVLRVAPSVLRKDLHALRADSKDQRVGARKDIRARALAGGYGPEARRLAAIVAGKAAGTATSALPAALRTDLQHLRTTTEPKSEQRRAAGDAIAQKALQGAYGDTIQQRVQQRQQRCAAK